ncbi:hypothetical protein, partial [Paraburkholderia sp. XV]|uniref:hypothetical protein n=1 Tax=Paraburkholderia sp. XV TaxID=2831520 RepID=UPI001CD4089C
AEPRQHQREWANVPLNRTIQLSSSYLVYGSALPPCVGIGEFRLSLLFDSESRRLSHAAPREVSSTVLVPSSESGMVAKWPGYVQCQLRMRVMHKKHNVE